MIVLASASPRRRELLANAGIDFVVRPVDVDETPLPGEDAASLVHRLAREKALACAATLPRELAGCPVLGADTTVTLDSDILNKPRDAADAARMLRALSGRTHNVMTGVCLVLPDLREGGAEMGAPVRSDAATQNATAVTSVTFRTLTEQEIADYVAGGEPMDKAGAYAIQGRASRWVTGIEGCYFNVVGLPVSQVVTMLEATRSSIG